MYGLVIKVAHLSDKIVRGLVPPCLGCMWEEQRDKLLIQSLELSRGKGAGYAHLEHLPGARQLPLRSKHLGRIAQSPGPACR